MRPERPITDYNTRFSGITAAMMAGVRTTLAEARGRLAALVPAEALLVGHALQNDLVALRLAHGRILDTALLYPHPKVRVRLRVGLKGPGALKLSTWSRCGLRVLDTALLYPHPKVRLPGCSRTHTAVVLVLAGTSYALLCTHAAKAPSNRNNS